MLSHYGKYEDWELGPIARGLSYQLADAERDGRVRDATKLRRELQKLHKEINHRRANQLKMWN